MNLENFFSIPVYFSSIDSTTIENTLSKVNDYLGDQSFKSAFTTYHDENRNFLGMINDLDLLTAIDINSDIFLNQLGYETGEKIIENWLNVNPKFASHDVHQHYGSLISGVLYLKSDEDSGDLIFYDPVKERQQFRAYNKRYEMTTSDNYYSTINCEPCKGNLIMFESWLSHSVGINLSDSNRTSIAFNVRKK